ncbi:geranylgeranylglyceryl/heptaprenylglyceryl phosphate synthase [Photorhabdus bodei]|uniref:Geranylgeranylglyceryl/heptaprenylglyceryl phosphate synthase n=1 Tax=Photorhabdus bodei TaxID=2029681 RepID=A0ABX0AL08_9GAMM|nr:geranylgeranylglyceryl/heptaprenylglyceryl phosphate synthase [Photorhabdus bodei]NDK98651.1 geranylgeranylglyceryl/heptaprenylglyceryl phosphate synthase [Photorhabdus bodei]NDL02904.1 geranylgeranylglyceryl/heptaprenylglyceryl phosphate synthase [Photorhabdus bodei]NDL07109.1 geranylgeranylglyceryl/heptaprenylglyceryl phosphate synthase [Photorhabdus bodei]
MDICKYMSSCRKSIIPILDPFKFNYEININRLLTFQKYAPFCIIASTDCENFEMKVSPFIAAASKIKTIPIITHFPPQKPNGFPSSPYADAFFATSVINSNVEYYSSLSLERESIKQSIEKYGDNCLISSAALVLGNDKKSQKFVYSKTVYHSTESIASALEGIDFNLLKVFYLYSRNSVISNEICGFVKSLIGNNILLFVSGGISNTEQVDNLLYSGADFISIGTTFEEVNWNNNAINILNKERRY